jgi:Sap, sulfolipid-1-addressing protein
VGQAIGDSLPLAIGVAISPIPIIAVILMLLSKDARSNSLAFAAGWVLGVAGALAIVIAVSGTIGTTTDGGPSHGVSIIKIVLGGVLIVVAVRDWMKRPKPGEEASLPGWLQAIEQMHAAKCFGVGIVISAANPKILLLLVGGGLAIAGAPTTGGGEAVAAAIFVALAVSTVIVPVVGYRLFQQQMEAPLASLSVWLERNNLAVMAVLFLVIGVALLGKGIAGF